MAEVPADPATPRKRRGVVPMFATAALLAVGTTACSSDGAPEPTEAEYTVQLEAICAATVAQLDALPTPPDAITVTEFATQASTILVAEAEQVRAIDPPADLDDDHRALIRNGEEQGAAWDDLAAAAGVVDSDLASITTRISELGLGRNDLVIEMGAPGCARSAG